MLVWSPCSVLKLSFCPKITFLKQKFSLKNHKKFAWRNRTWNHRNVCIFVTRKRSCPAGNYICKVKKRIARTRCKKCSKLTIKTPERRHISFYCYLWAGKCRLEESRKVFIGPCQISMAGYFANSGAFFCWKALSKIIYRVSICLWRVLLSIW